MRVKGFVWTGDFHEITAPELPIPDKQIYVEEIPPDAIICEATFSFAGSDVVLILPESFGYPYRKRVKVIIFEEESE